MADRREYMRKWRKEHKESVRATRNKWNAKHPEKITEYNHRQYLRRKALKNGSGGVSGGDVNNGMEKH